MHWRFGCIPLGPSSFAQLGTDRALGTAKSRARARTSQVTIYFSKPTKLRTIGYETTYDHCTSLELTMQDTNDDAAWFACVSMSAPPNSEERKPKGSTINEAQPGDYGSILRPYRRYPRQPSHPPARAGSACRPQATPTTTHPTHPHTTWLASDRRPPLEVARERRTPLLTELCDHGHNNTRNGRDHVTRSMATRAWTALVGRQRRSGGKTFMITQRIKDLLVELGPNSWLVRMALKLRERVQDANHVRRCNSLAQRQSPVEIGSADFYLVPMVLDSFDHFFDEM